MSRKLRFPVLAATLAAASAFLPADGAAQHAVPRSHSAIVVSGGYYHPYYFYDLFYWSWGLWPGLYAQYPYPYPPYDGYAYYDNSGSARIQVKPRETQVFIDGYFVGTVDEFDGVFQRLHVEPGEHEIALYLEGYRTIRQKVLFRPGATLKLTYVMEKLPAGEPNEPRPTPDPNAPPRLQPPDRSGAPVPARPPYRGERNPERGDFGTLAIRVQPSDAVIMIDGERWEGSRTEDRFRIELAEGPHRLEVRNEGFRTYIATVRVKRGETVTLNVSLTSGDRDAAPSALTRR